MGTMIGMGMVVAMAESSEVSQDASAKECTNFYSRNGVTRPSPLFDDIGDTFYFAKNRAGQFVCGNRFLQERRRLASAEDIIGRFDHDFFRRDIADRIRAVDKLVMDTGFAVKNKLEVIDDANGKLIWLFITTAPLRDRNGEIVGVEGFSRDAQRSEDLIAPFREFRPCIEHVQKHLSEEISMSELAALACMSLSTFERKFKEHFSRTPKQYILHLKVLEACRLLPGNCTIARVALESGFGDQGHFTAQFKKVVGITPKQYQCLSNANRRRQGRLAR